MRPWQRTRQADRPGDAVESPSTPFSARQPEWPTVAPIQRIVGTMRPVSPQQDFADSLTSWRNPSFLAPLGHLVSADAPAGVIHRLIEPAAPPARGPGDPALEFAAAPARRPIRGGAVQRMLATISSWASRESHPSPAPAGDAPSGTTRVAPLPVAAPAPGSAPRAEPVTPVQRSAPGAAPVALPLASGTLTQAPSPTMPVLELPVQSATTGTAGQLQSSPAESHLPLDPLAAAGSDMSEAPTLGMDEAPRHETGMTTSPSVTQPTDGGVSGPADVTSQERRAIAPAVEASGRPAPLNLPAPVQRTAEGDRGSAMPAAVDAAPTLGMGAAPSVTQPAGGGERGPAEVSGTSAVPVVRASQPAPSQRPAHRQAQVQRTASVDPGAPLSRRLGLGPPLGPDAAASSHPAGSSNPARPMVEPPLVVPPVPTMAGPAETSETAAVDAIAPLLGQPGPVPVQGDAAAIDTTSVPVPTVQTAPEASPGGAEPPLPLLPVARIQASPMSSAADPPASPADAPQAATTERTLPAPIVPARPVLARLVGDWIPPLHTASAPTHPRADPPGRAQQGVAAGIQRTVAEPRFPSSAPVREHGGFLSSAPARDHPVGSIEQLAVPGLTSVAVGAPLPPVGYLNGGSAALPVQAISSSRHLAPVVQAVAPQTPVVQMPVVQTAEPLAEPTIEPAPGTAPGAVGGEPESPGAASSAASAEALPAGAPAAGAATGGGPAAGGPAAGGSPDELVKKLFDPLLRRLKTELRLDRERRGMLTDLRH